ncbi:uncharacterized transmembrane protein DDB_G0289901-like isoform X7 [Macrobrachium nipponense]|uniref:uncharacterized transmembrane protein DDB_G0289901-like isoform X7 n=1 Tax=Macrobrachium nipponense TaxID=159736 RepID=UPI0030C7AEE9
MAQNLLQLLTALFLCFNLASGQLGGNPGGNLGGNPGGNLGGCTYNDEWHAIGTNFAAQLSTGGPPEGNAVHYLCTGTGLIMLGCALPSTSGNPEESAVSFPIGSKRFFGCDEYECTDELGWVSTGVTAESCITNPPLETTTAGENGDSTVGGGSTTSDNEDSTVGGGSTTSDNVDSTVGGGSTTSDNEGTTEATTEAPASTTPDEDDSTVADVTTVSDNEGTTV